MTGMPRKTIRARALAGELVRGAMVFEFFTPGVAKMAALAGAEFALFDMEHTGLGLETLKTMVATCRGLGIAPMTRVPRGEYHFLARALDTGCHGVMIPMVESVAQARAIVEATHYPPRGRRGAAFGFANDDYEAGEVKAKIRRLDARNLVIAQIETERGLENVEAIAAVDGIDVLWVGHFDLTNFLGIPAQFDNPRYLNSIKRIVAAGRKHKKGLGFMPTDANWTRQYRKLGFNMLAAGTDPAILINGWKSILAPLD
jgi:2-dehydro-3-deoxyglucarate aldolase/4-hydroxy-2-oxoheptanedioate aldolase